MPSSKKSKSKERGEEDRRSFMTHFWRMHFSKSNCWSTSLAFLAKSKFSIDAARQSRDTNYDFLSYQLCSGRLLKRKMQSLSIALPKRQFFFEERKWGGRSWTEYHTMKTVITKTSWPRDVGNSRCSTLFVTNEMDPTQKVFPWSWSVLLMRRWLFARPNFTS